jgi:hypothetical protein
MKKFLGLLLICLAIGIAAPAYAGTIVGDTVNVTWYFPSASTVFEQATVAVPGTVTTFDAGLNSISIGDGVLVVNNGTAGWTQSSGFNGFAITDLTSIPNFTSLALVSLTGFAPPVGPILSFTADTLSVNFNASGTANLGSGVGQVYTFSYTTPEPSSLILLLGTGVISLATSRRKK